MHASIQEISASQWNALIQSTSPFVRYEFFLALEENGCVGQKFGWYPNFITLYDQQRLMAALPLYVKTNNYGEFVFDHSWQEAWESVGLPYYPKLVSAIPYTPARGPRLLVHSECKDKDLCRDKLLNAAKSLVVEENYSGLHFLFAEKSQQTWLSQQSDIQCRTDVQFHWFNQQYNTFDDFLATLKAKKRKNIKQERLAIKQAGITFRVLHGEEATEADWRYFAHIYAKTFNEKWGYPTLNEGFFKQIAQALPKQVILILADLDEQPIAGALFFRSEDTLYGRHWGCTQEVKYLHFETCFYQGIEYAIQKGLTRFEPGAGGEHKISRGFVPVVMHSSHWLNTHPFEEGIKLFIQQEDEMMRAYAKETLNQVPYRTEVCPREAEFL